MSDKKTLIKNEACEQSLPSTTRSKQHSKSNGSIIVAPNDLSMINGNSSLVSDQTNGLVAPVINVEPHSGVINQIDAMQVNEVNASSNQQPQSQHANCSICLNPITNRAVLEPCCHEFDYHCVAEWCQDHDTCPYCRNKCTGLLYNIVADSVFDRLAIRRQRRSSDDEETDTDDELDDEDDDDSFEDESGSEDYFDDSDDDDRLSWLQNLGVGDSDLEWLGRLGSDDEDEYETATDEEDSDDWETMSEHSVEDESSEDEENSDGRPARQPPM